ncbi:MAG: YcbK family protein [Rhizobiaceae bacterium]
MLAAVAAGMLLASCTTGGVPPLEVAMASVGETADTGNAGNAFAGGQTTLPDAVAVVPSANPGAGTAAEPAPLEAAEVAETGKAGGAETATETEEPTPQEAVTAATGEESTSAQAETVAVAAPPARKKRGFLSTLWSSEPRPAAPVDMRPGKRLVVASATPTPAKEPARKTVKPLIGGDALPGVRRDNKLFEINRKSGLDDNSDVDIDENEGAYRVASAGGLARLAPNGLLTQREGVDVACLKPSLVRVLKTVERHYGKRIVVTSGYRSPAYNRKARGARNSLHMYCAAADIQIDGVTKWELARYLRSMPGRGGVGTYCHTKSVHVDVGPERDWNWRCRRGKKRRK